MDSSKSSKPPKGIRKLMNRLGVSQSRSRSRSPLMVSQTDPRPDEEVGSASIGAGLGVTTLTEPAIENALLAQQSTKREVESHRANVSEAPASSSKSDKRPESIAWTALRTSLQYLHDSSSAVPTLSSAVGILLSCIDGLEAVAKNREDYEELATTLCAMSDGLKQLSSSGSLSDSVSNLSLSIERQAIEIRRKLDHIKANSFRNANANEEELLKHYRRVQSLFRQLQANASVNTWSMMNEQSVNSRLDTLHTVKEAVYDSSLSTQVSRRSCTEGTRTAILAGLDTWLLDTSSASIYWMNGMAGTGKTTIAYSFCEQAEKRKQLAASFFCSRNAVECRNTSRIVPTIAYQLARYSTPYRSALCKVLGQNPDIGSKHVQKQFEQLLKEPLQQVKASIPDDLVVVIDALDECDDRNGVDLILDMLFRYAGQVPLKFLVTSRPEPEIYHRMQLHTQSRAVIHLHDIEASLVRADIALYLTEELAFMSPSRTEVEQLAHRSGCLFIYAATLVRYILYGKRVANPRQRLQSVLNLTSESTKKHAEIDALYTAILESALHEAQMEEHETQDVKTVLRTVLFSQEPIDVETIAALGGLDDPERVVYALQPLRSVIYQSEKTGLVSPLHASFPDFLLSYQRSGAFFCDVVQYSQLLAQRCFGVMKSQLRFNICELESSFVPDDEVNDLDARIEMNITRTLGYVCQYWASHLGMATRSGVLTRMLNEFLSQRLLFWMEVLNVMKMIDTGIDMLQKATVWISQIGSPVSEEALIKLVDDSYTFVTNVAGSAASRSTAHIYISCLPFCSRSSEVYKHYWKRTQGLLQLKGSLIDQRDSAAIASWQDEKTLVGAFSSDGSRFLGGRGDALVIRNVYNGVILVGPMLGHTDRVCACSFSMDGSRAVSASKDGTVRIWDAYSGKLIVNPIKYDTSHIIALGSPGDVPDPVPVPFISIATHCIQSIVWSPDGTRIAGCFALTSTIYLWDANTGMLLHVLQDPLKTVRMLAMSPDGTLLASASGSSVQLWRVQDGTLAAPPYVGHTPFTVVCTAFTPDSTRVVSCSRDIQVWRIYDGSLISKIAFDIKFSRLAVSPDGTQVVSATSDWSGTLGSTLRVWKLDDGTLLAGPYHSGISINLLGYTPEGTRLISHGGGGGIIAVWAVQGIKSNPTTFHRTIGSPMTMFSVDATHLLTRDIYSKAIGRWDVHDGSFSHISDEGYTFPDKAAKSAQFSQDSTKLVIGSRDGTVTLWDLDTRVAIAGPFSGHSKPIHYVALSPDNSLIASAAENTQRILNTFDPILDIVTTTNPKLGPLSNLSSNRFKEGWCIQNDGWVTNTSLDLLFWVPFEFRLAWPALHTSLIITRIGTVQVPKQSVFLGEAWHKCYNSD
ncbi:vegetative incompatibility protein HET-E-1 [Rhizoctonia solani 123E]|uniref:Vegetative incompatibility protein HET-E-1 n=1 Tax=Rhizoctonia solani 123E TaxID=1423351 RepID=A0A074RS05_9AGAM|nr:vegetative incompatibility protein HET-E-1 [Rhizoctonia solani 123E]